MGKKISLECVLYVGPAGSLATTEVENVVDANFNIEKGEADMTVRGSGWEAMRTTLLSATVEFQLRYDPNDASFEQIRAAFFAVPSTPVAFAVLDGPDGNGLDADFEITRFGRNEPLREGVTVPVTIKPTNITRAPDWKKA